MESTDSVGDRENIDSKGTNAPGVVLPHKGVLTPQNEAQRIKRCPECGSDSLDIHIDSKGEIFLFCLRSMDMFPAYASVL